MTKNQPDKVFLTQKGLEKLQSEYEELVGPKRKGIAARTKEARALGDLSENAEYKATREEQSFTEGRITELEHILKNAEVIEEVEGGGVVQIGCKVKLHLEEQEHIFEIVGAQEADPTQSRISHESPLGQALLGKKVGDEVEIEAPVGKIIYKVIEVL